MYPVLAEGLHYRSGEFVRYIFATAAIGVAPLVLLFLSGLLSLVPVLVPVGRVLIFLAFIGILPGQFWVVNRAHNSMTLRRGEPRVVFFSALFFTIGLAVCIVLLISSLD